MSVFTNIIKRVRKARTQYRNWRRGRRTLPPYVVLSLSGEIEQFARPSPLQHVPFSNRLPLPESPWSVSELRRIFETLALDPRIQGVVLHIGMVANTAIYQSLRKILLDFRSSGKKIIAYAESFGPFQYYLACACDQVIMPPSAEWMVLGFQNDYVFLKDALDTLGVGFDVVRVSPFKSYGDQFVRNDFSEDARAQAEWLLDARYDELVRGIAEGRRISPERVRELINCAPFSAAECVQHGLLDAALYEDELERYLVPEPIKRPEEHKLMNSLIKRLPPHVQAQLSDYLDEDNDSFGFYDDIEDSLLIPQFEYEQKLIGVIKIEGTIMPGNSFHSPLPLPMIGEQTAGSATIAQIIRRAEKDKSLAAVILYVNSPGGSALASDLIAREIRRLKASKPVVVYMDGVAASGGYYVAALGNAIVAQPLTLTGSIGVVSMKPHTEGAFAKLKLHRVLLERGQRAGMLSDATPFNDDQRTAMEQMIARAYSEFKQIVAEGRQITIDDLEPICGGRVWTGSMALERRLVDQLGDVTVAIQKARELAGIVSEKRVRAVLMTPPRHLMLPLAFSPNPAGVLLQGIERLRDLFLSQRTWAISLWGSDKTR